jgi:hypothetical protein
MPSPPARSRRAAGRTAVLAAAASAAAVLLAALPAAAQPPVLRNDEELAFDRPEAWAMQYFTSVSFLGGFGPPERRRPGSVELDLELGWIPELDEEEREVGFAGTKAEDVNKAPVFVRPRVVVGLPRGFSLTAGYVPPVEVFDVEAHLFALSLGRPLVETATWRLGARIHAQGGTVTSDITCPDEVVGSDDPRVNPSGCGEPSSDEITMRYAGFELAAARDDGASRWVPYGALSGNWLDMAFQVDALTFGLRDRSLLTADGFVWSAAAGLRYRHPSGAELALEGHYTPLTVRRQGVEEDEPLLHVRLLLAWRLLED